MGSALVMWHSVLPISKDWPRLVPRSAAGLSFDLGFEGARGFGIPVTDQLLVKRAERVFLHPPGPDRNQAPAALIKGRCLDCRLFAR
jgi:hypothetical protein